jgi:threonine dehydrogenase-like Zn-dependent dehydrogenase
VKEDVYNRIQDLTHGRGADACIDTVGTEPHTSASFDSMLDRVKVAAFLGTDRPHVLRQAIHNTRNFGVVSIIGVYGGFLDKVPLVQRFRGTTRITQPYRSCRSRCG